MSAPVDGYLADVPPVTLAIGIGGGLAFPSLFTLALSSAGQTDSGLASGLVNTSQHVGGAIVCPCWRASPRRTATAC